MTQSAPDTLSAAFPAILKEIAEVMSGYIPQFDQKFILDFDQNAINEVRQEKTFEIQSARALVFGETGVGKTTTINYLLDSPVFPTSGELSCTKSLACGEHKGGLVFYDSPGLGDEAALENVTRIALGIPPLDEEPLETVSLLDITAHNQEGPALYETLAYADFEDEISQSFYQDHQDHIQGKAFKVEDFSAWASDNFDFYIFVSSSNRGLPTPIARVLQAFDQVPAHQGKLFKVFNVFDQQYQAEDEALPQAIRNKYQQAIDRSHKYGLYQADAWFLIDSQAGHGLEALIKAFAQALPLDVLRSLTQVVQKRYTHLIQEKLASYFFDYTAHIAALLAVFPVNHQTQGLQFFRFALDSMLTMARFVFADQANPAATQIVEDIVAQLEFSKKRKVYVEPRTPESSGGFLSRLLQQLGRNTAKAHPDAMPIQREAGETYFAVGGVDAIQVILAFGLTLQALHQTPQYRSSDLTQVEALLEQCRRFIEAQMGYRAKSQIITQTRVRPEESAQAEKLASAKALYPIIRPLMTFEYLE